MVVRTEKIENESIYVIDQMLPDNYVREFYKTVSSMRMQRAEETLAGDNYPIFSVDFAPEKFEKLELIGKTSRKLLLDFFPSDKFNLQRSYVNMCHYGDVALPHRDCKVGVNNITVLYYVNAEWKHSWGGETMFYENGESKAAVLPKPGRFVIFRGAIEHSGTIPSRICSVSRLTLALKYKTL